MPPVDACEQDTVKAILSPVGGVKRKMSDTLPVASVVIADDHALVRNGLKDIVRCISGFSVSIVGEAENGVEAIAVTKTMRPDLLLLDAGMPLSRGIEVFVEVRRWSPDTSVAVVTGFTSARSLSDWISAGVDGLFVKSCPPEEMAKGFEKILNGERYISEDVSRIVGNDDGAPDLTLREQQVLNLVAEGCSNAGIAERLGISEKTVDNHRYRMMAKLNVHSIAQLIAYALKEGLLDSFKQS